MIRLIFIISSCIFIYNKALSEIIWSSPRPYTQIPYCNEQCFEIFDTVIGGWVRDTLPYYQHLIVFSSSAYSDTIQVPMRNIRFKYCFEDTGHYDISNLYSSIDNDGIVYCCSGVKFKDFISITGCPPSIDFTISNDTICNSKCISINDSFTRRATNYNWEFEGGTPNHFYGKSPPKICYLKEGSYYIIATAENDYGSTLVKKENIVTVVKCDECIFVPSAFSPNDDGINDLFKTHFGCNIINYKISIYNRWGNCVFESQDIYDSWNGKYKNTTCENDTYSYIISYTVKENKKIGNKKGSILLLK